MRKVRTLQTNFASGQLDPLMAARSDTKSYVNGAETLTNVMNLVQGGVKRRMGMKYLGIAFDHQSQSRLIPFVFNDEQQYILSTGYDVNSSSGAVYIFNPDTGSLITTLTGFPWTATSHEFLTYTQRNDVLILSHEDMPTQVITRTGATTFTRSDFAFDEDLSGGKRYSPFYAFQAGTVTITPSARTGNITLVTSANHWTADHVGARVSIHGQQCEVTGFTNAQLVTATVQEDLFMDQDIVVTDSSEYIIGEVVTQTDTEAQGEIVAIPNGTTIRVANLKQVKFATQSTGEATVGGLSGAAQQASSVADVTTPLATRDWKEEAFSAARGYPRSVLFHGQRLWFGGSRDLPAHLFSSKISAFFNFDTGTALDDESIQAPITSNQVNTIKHLVSAGHLQVFTDQAEFYCPETQDSPLTPTTFNVRRQSSYGCADVMPLAFDRATLFVQNTGKVVREFKWEEIEGGCTPNAISLIASNLLDSGGIVDTAVIYGLENRAEQYAFFLNADGTLAVYHAARNEQISAWSKWETNGQILSICTLSGKLYATVDRPDDGQPILEVFDENITLDSAQTKTYTTARNNFIFSSSVLNDQTVGIVADYHHPNDDDYVLNAFYLGDDVVTTQTVNLPNSYLANRVTVGYNFDAVVKTMPIDYGAADGQILGIPKKISSVDVLLNSTLAAKVQGKNLILRDATDDFSTPATPKTGRERFYLLGWDKLGQVEIKSTTPLDFTLLGLLFEVAY